jgi:uncharacterized protein
MKKKIVIAGGSGFLGQSLLEKFRHPDTELVVLTRKPGYRNKGVSFIQWDAKSAGKWIEALEGSTAVINLVGRSVNCRYTEKNKKEIIGSRVNATIAIGNAIRRLERPPDVWINAGSTAIFGDAGEVIKNEDSAAGEGFSPEVCKKWEEAFNSNKTPHTRKVLLRMGLVFQKNRGLLKPFIRLAKLGLGGKIGSGEQYISWVHEDDFTRLIQLAIERKDYEGTIHCASPFPVKNKEFLKIIRQSCRVPFGVPNPSFLIKAGAVLIGTEAELLLTGRRVVSKTLEQKGFNFRYARIEEALDHLVRD